MNIKTLIKKIESEAKPDRFGDAAIMIGRNEASENYASLSRSTRGEIEEIRDNLSRLIPDDFEFHVWIEKSSIDLIMMYYDGMESGTNLPISIDLEGDYRRDLLDVNWDEQRKYCIPIANHMDALVEATESLPGDIPSTAAAQVLHHEALVNFKETAQNNSCKYGVIAYNNNEHKYEMLFQDRRKHMLGYMCDFLTFRWPIIAILDEGELMSVQDTEKLKFEVVGGLGKVSKALALGKLGTNMNMI